MRLLITKVLCSLGLHFAWRECHTASPCIRVPQEFDNTNNIGFKVMKNRVILLILDGLGYSYARQLMGNLEGWIEAEEARVWQGQAVLP